MFNPKFTRPTRRTYLGRAILILALLSLLLPAQMPFGNPFAARPLLAATIVVDAGGGGDHTTIQAAVNASSAGDTIQINSGTYNESVNISNGAGSLTFVGNNTGGGLPTITGVDSFSNSAPETADFTFQNLIISGSNEGILLTDVTGTVQILGSQFNAQDKDHIQIITNNGVTTVALISGNTFSDTASNEQGVDINGNGTGVSNVTIVDNTFNNDQNHIFAVYNGTSANKLFVSNNTHNGVAGVAPIFVRSVDTATGIVTIVQNTISSPDGDGIGINMQDTSSLATVISNNTFTSIGSGSTDNGISITGNSTDTPTLNAVIANNTFGTTGTVAEAGIRVEGNAGAAIFNLVVKDNNFAKTNSFGGSAALEVLAEGATINVDIRSNTIPGTAAVGILLDADVGSVGTINIEDAAPNGNSGPNNEIGEITDNNPANVATTPVIKTESNPGHVNYTVSNNAVNDANIPLLLGDFIWNDNGAGGGSAGDGIQNGTEPGIPGVAIALSGAATGTTFTDANGNYYFSVIPGNYTLTVTPPSGLSFSPQDQNAENLGTDSDFNTGTGQAGVTISAGTDDLKIDAGLFTPPVNTEVTLNTGTLTITDINGGTSADALTISYAGSTYTIQDTGGLIIQTAIAGATGSGTATVTVPDTGVTGIHFDTLAGADSITVTSVQASLSGGFTITGGADTDTIAINGAVNSGSGNINLSAENMSIGAAISGSASLTIQPETASTTIGLGGGTGSLNLDDTELSFLQNGFASITIGKSDAGNITLDSATFNDNLTLLTGGAIVDANDSGTDITNTGNTVILDGTLSPGSSPGVFSVAGNVSFADNSSFAVELTGTPSGGSHDQLDVTGSVTIGSNVALALTTGSYTKAAGTITIVNNDGADGITGTFAGLGEGAQTNSGNDPNFLVSYVGGSGNDIVLTATDPTAAGLADFRAAAEGGTLAWETLSESNLSGFHIWRGSPSQAETRLTDSLIGAVGGLTGHGYTWQDAVALTWGERVYYWLEMVEADGNSSFVGPVEVLGNGRLYLPSVGR